MRPATVVASPARAVAVLAAVVAALLTRRLGAAGPYHESPLDERGSDALA